MIDLNSQAFYHNFVWYLQHEDALALEESSNSLACAVRDTYADLLPISSTTEGQVREFNRACTMYREETNVGQTQTADNAFLFYNNGEV